MSLRTTLIDSSWSFTARDLWRRLAWPGVLVEDRFIVLCCNALDWECERERRTKDKRTCEGQSSKDASSTGTYGARVKFGVERDWSAED